MSPAPTLPGPLLDIFPGLGHAAQRLAILGEGIRAADAGTASFLVTAGGSNLATLAAAAHPRFLTTADAAGSASRIDRQYLHHGPGLGGDSVPSLPWPPRA